MYDTLTVLVLALNISNVSEYDKTRHDAATNLNTDTAGTRILLVVSQ